MLLSRYVVSNSYEIPLDCSPPGSSVHGISQVRILEWVAISFSRGSSWPRDWTWVSYISCIGKQILYHRVTWEALPLCLWLPFFFFPPAKEHAFAFVVVLGLWQNSVSEWQEACSLGNGTVWAEKVNKIQDLKLENWTLEEKSWNWSEQRAACAGKLEWPVWSPWLGDAGRKKTAFPIYCFLL